MKANLIKDEESLDDLHPKKNVIRPKKIKIKDGKKNRIIRQKPLKFTSIIPQLESSDDKDYKPSARKPRNLIHPEALPRPYDSDDSEDFEVSKDFEASKGFDKEEPASTKTYMLTSHASFVSAILLGTGGEPKMDSDFELGVRVKTNNLFEPEMVSDDEIGVQVKSTRFQRYLHPKKTVLNVKSKKFKTKVGKKNQTIRQKALNELTSKTQLEPEEDLDTEFSNDDNKCIAKQPVQFFYGEAMSGCGSEDSDDSIPEHFEVSEDFDKEEPASTKKTYMVTSHASLVSAILLGTGGEPKMDSDYEMGVQVKPTLFEPDYDEPKMVSDHEIGVQVKSTVRPLKTYVRRNKGKQAK